jgi:cytoskeleton protein RodZ
MNKGKILPEPGTESPAVSTEHDLKAVREAKGIALKDIFLTTRITVVNLEAIEEGRFHLLPEPVYTRTFIKSYANFLGIEDRPILERYEKYLISLKYPLQPPEDPHKKPDAEKMAGNKRRVLLWAGAAMLIIVVLLYFFTSRDADVPPSPNPQSPSPMQQPTAPPPKEVPTPPGYTQNTPAAPGATTAPATDGGPQGTAPSSLPEKVIGTLPAVQQASGALADKRLRLVITGVEQTWIRIREDQKRSQDMMIERGDVIERLASDSFTLDVGNAGGVEISFQGKPLGTLGKSGQVVHLKLP